MKAILKKDTEKTQISNRNWRGTFDLTSDITLGSLGLYTMTYDAGGKGAEPHYHKIMKEFFNVLEGAVSVLINGEWQVVEAGSSVVIPPMVVHGFKPLQERGCKIQILFTPNIQRENFFLDFHLYENASDKEKYEFWAKYDQYPPEVL